jgi:hypothetical protein
VPWYKAPATEEKAAHGQQEQPCGAAYFSPKNILSVDTFYTLYSNSAVRRFFACQKDGNAARNICNPYKNCYFETRIAKMCYSTAY